MMVLGAMAGYAATWATGSPWLGLGAGMLAAGALGLLYALAVVTLRADQVVSGLALTWLGTGLSSVLGAPLAAERHPIHQVPVLTLPLLHRIPLLGPVFFSQNAVVYLGFLLVPVSSFFLYRTRPGLHLRAVGEHPAAADVLGVRVQGTRYLYVLVGGLLAGLGGASVSLAITPGWVVGTASGLGFIAVGLVLFARWDPLRAAFGAYLFGAVARLPLDLQGLKAFPALQNPRLGPLLNMLPYLCTIMVLVLEAQRRRRAQSAAPAALGLPYVRGTRE
jgi:simple sugar transport system permease protein